MLLKYHTSRFLGFWVAHNLLITKHQIARCWRATCYHAEGDMFQTTIANESFAEGVGLHTGVYGHVRLVPAPAETGIVFRRVDLDNFLIEAQGQNVARVSYATSLMKQGVCSTPPSICSPPFNPVASTTFTSTSTRSKCPSWTALHSP